MQPKIETQLRTFWMYTTDLIIQAFLWPNLFTERGQEC